MVDDLPDEHGGEKVTARIREVAPGTVQVTLSSNYPRSRRVRRTTGMTRSVFRS